MEEYFKEYRQSNEFLNLLLDTVNVGVLIADEKLRIRHFNNTFAQVFGTPREKVLRRGFGTAVGCRYHVDEGKPCGETSYCAECGLRRSLLKTMVRQAPVDKVKMKGTYYIHGHLVTKHLEVSTRPITYRGCHMILVILYDVSETEQQKIELREKQRQIDRDLEAAARIQHSLLPASSMGHRTVEVAWKFKPSRRVGGDIFNLCYPLENRLDLYMLDACGHGVSAAFIAVSVSHFLQSRRSFPGWDPSACSPDRVLNILNQAFPFERFDTYFTIAYLSIDLLEGTLSYSNAGHPSPLVLHRDGRLVFLDERGPSIGMNPMVSYRCFSIALEPNDRLILYTDGILDMVDKHYEPFGISRFVEVLRSHHDRPLQAFVDGVEADLRRYRAGTELEDDMSLLVIEYSPQRAGAS